MYSCNKFAQKWLLQISSTPQALHCATAPCEFSHSKADINISQGNVAKHLRCGKVFNDQ